MKKILTICLLIMMSFNVFAEVVQPNPIRFATNVAFNTLPTVNGSVVVTNPVAGSISANDTNTWQVGSTNTINPISFQSFRVYWTNVVTLTATQAVNYANPFSDWNCTNNIQYASSNNWAPATGNVFAAVTPVDGIYTFSAYTRFSISLLGLNGVKLVFLTNTLQAAHGTGVIGSANATTNWLAVNWGPVYLKQGITVNVGFVTGNLITANPIRFGPFLAGDTQNMAYVEGQRIY